MIAGVSVKMPVYWDANSKYLVYQFVKEALIRKFGEEWYEQLEAAAKIINNQWLMINDY